MKVVGCFYIVRIDWLLIFFIFLVVIVLVWVGVFEFVSRVRVFFYFDK